MRPNIYELLKSEFKVYDCLIDIGCSGMQDLTDFEVSPFKKLIGIDKHFDDSAFSDYIQYKRIKEQTANIDHLKFSMPVSNHSEIGLRFIPKIF